jgi:hypothetical protein
MVLNYLIKYSEYFSYWTYGKIVLDIKFVLGNSVQHLFEICFSLANSEREMAETRVGAHSKSPLIFVRNVILN